MANLVLPVAGAPLTAEIVEEVTRKLPDATWKTEVTISKVSRDAAGRMRIEANINSPDGDATLAVQIMDRAEGFMALLIPAENAGGRLNFPKQDPSAPGNIAFFGGPLIEVPGTKSVKSEPIGKQIIEGIAFQGDRTTTTSDGQPSLVGVEEHWMNRELGLIGLMKSSGPNEQTSAKLRNIRRVDPDPSLFRIPPDYDVRDLKDTAPPH